MCNNIKWFIKNNDPVRLYKNLAFAFERRGRCIYTNTVQNAFRRLQNDIVKQGRILEFEKGYFGLTNNFTKAILSTTLPKEIFYRVLSESNNDILLRATSEVLASKKDLPKKSVLDLLLHSNTNIFLGALKGIANRSDFSNEEIFKSVEHLGDNYTKDLFLGILSSKPEFMSKEQFFKELKSYGSQRAYIAVSLRHDLADSELRLLLNSDMMSVRNAAARRIVKRLTKDEFFYYLISGKIGISYLSDRKDLSYDDLTRDFKSVALKQEVTKAVDARVSRPLKFNSGRKVDRVRKMQRLTNNLHA